MPAHRLVRFVMRVGWCGGLVAIALALLSPDFAGQPAVQWSPWLLGLLVLGIPHGAFDHKVGAELDGRGSRSAGPGFYAAYLSVGALVMACWFVSPVVACLGFLGVAAGHFGQGDVYWSRETGLAAWSGSVGYRVSLLLVRSALPIALPLLAHPREFSGEAAAMTARLFGRSAWVVPPWLIGGGLAAVAALVVLNWGWAAWIGLKLRGEAARAAWLDGSETLLLAALFWVVPPVLALGVYFNAWHSLRHVARLLTVDGPGRTRVEAGSLTRAFGRFARQAVPMTAGAVVLMAGLGLVVGRGLASVTDLGLLAVVLLSALTLPHVLVVTWMDYRQRVWSRRPGRWVEEAEHVRI